MAGFPARIDGMRLVWRPGRRRRLILAAICFLSASAYSQSGPSAPPQTSAPPALPPTIQVQSNIVFVPATVESKDGQIVYDLTANEFLVKDNGAPQQARMEEEADSLGLSLAVVVQCSRSAVMEYAKISGLDTMVESIAGGAPHEIAVIAYGDKPHVLGDFSSNPDATERAIGRLEPCDDGNAATLDAVSAAAAMLDARQNEYRHAILLIGETRDHGSRARPADVIAELGRTNTVVDAVAFSPGRNELLSDLRYDTGSGPLGMLYMAVSAMRRNVPKTLAGLSGGQYIRFSSQKNFDSAMLNVANHIHNYYLLSFQPQPPTSNGLHALSVSLPRYPQTHVYARASYWYGPLPAPTADGR